MKRSIIIFNVTVVFAVIAIAAFVALNQSKPTNLQSATPSDNTVREITREEVAVHNTPADCWAVIGDGVYDITAYLPRHPGGKEIEAACGVDATEMFETKSSTQMDSSRTHSNVAREQLNTLRIGTLSQ